MTRPEFDIFLLGGSILCGLMCLVTLGRYKSRGPSALALGGAFAALAGTLLLLRAGAETNFVAAGFVFVVLLLGADFALRAQRGGGPSR
jgi:hypothetical protein